jgi:lysophospholipase L1-like esterase
MRLTRKLALGVAALSTVLLTPAAATAAGTAAPAATPAAAAQEYDEYVALGDSFASLGSLTKTYLDPRTGCLRSTDNYPARLADRLGSATFTDATCAGAVTGGVLDSQLGALSPQTDLVTLSIGGNDVGFVNIAATCGLLSLTNPFGNPCEEHYTSGGTDRLAEDIAETRPKVDAVLAAITDRAPNAEVVVIGYLRILPERLGCWPLMPISVDDVGYVNSVQDQLNAMIGASAHAAGATFVDPSTTRGHDACQLPWNRWVDGLLPLSNATPIHPTAAGQRHVAGLVHAGL